MGAGDPFVARLLRPFAWLALGIFATPLAADMWLSSERVTVVFVVDATCPAGAACDGMAPLTGGHVDLSFGYDGRAGRLGFDEIGTGGEDVRRDFATHYVHVPASAERTMSQAALDFGLGFVGAGAGDRFYEIPAVQTPGVIFLGLNAYQADVNALLAWNPEAPERFANSLARFVEVSLVDMRGPEGGDAALFEFDPFVHYLSTAVNGVDLDDRFYLVADTHRHYVWTFTEPGIYELDFVARIRRADDFQVWAENRGLPASERSLDRDSDRDGLANGLEYVFDGNPVEPRPAGLGVLFQIGATGDLEVTLLEDGRADLNTRLEVWTPGDTSGWQALADYSAGTEATWSGAIIPVLLESNGGLATYRLPLGLDQTATAIYRLRVSDD